MTMLARTAILLLGLADAFPQWHPWSESYDKSCEDVSPGYDADLVVDVATQISSHSWEYGTAAETLLELYNPVYSVFSQSAFPNDEIPRPSADITSLAYAAAHVRLNNDTLIDGDGANGDPASLGVSAILLAQTEPTNPVNLSETYSAAVIRQANHLLSAPHMSNGAISHRDNSAQAWADFIYMGPPFLAYHAVDTNNMSLLSEATRQCGLYKDLLHFSSSPPQTYWRHIIDESPLNTTNRSMNDPGIWSTGNAWAAMGMARVLATIKHWSPASQQLIEEQSNLTTWILEILDGARSVGVDPTNGLLRNYLNNETWFGEVSGSGMLAATVYRLAVLEPEMVLGPGYHPHHRRSKQTQDLGYIAWADDLRAAVSRTVTSNGTVSPAINPLNWFDLTPFTSGSPEGQSFAGQLGAAYRDWICSGLEVGR